MSIGQPSLERDYCQEVLVVEDNIVNREVVVAMLRSLGFAVQEASSGSEAVELASSRRFRAILMDVRMPQMDGWEATRCIRASGGPNAGTPIVALTASRTSTDLQRCLLSGMDGVVEKPVSLDDLRGILDGSGPQATRRLGRAQASITSAGPAVSTRSRRADRPGSSSFAELFVEDTTVKLGEMREALRQRRLDAVAELAHSMGGACGVVGADSMRGLCARLQLAARDGSLRQARRLTGQLEAGLAAFAGELTAPPRPRAR